MDRKLGYQRLSKLLFRIDHLEISNSYDANMENLVVAVDAALWFIPEYPQFLRWSQIFEYFVVEKRVQKDKGTRSKKISRKRQRMLNLEKQNKLARQSR